MQLISINIYSNSFSLFITDWSKSNMLINDLCLFTFQLVYDDIIIVIITLWSLLTPCNFHNAPRHIRVETLLSYLIYLNLDKYTIEEAMWSIQTLAFNLMHLCCKVLIVMPAPLPFLLHSAHQDSKSSVKSFTANIKARGVCTIVTICPPSIVHAITIRHHLCIC